MKIKTANSTPANCCTETSTSTVISMEQTSVQCLVFGDSQIPPTVISTATTSRPAPISAFFLAVGASSTNPLPRPSKFRDGLCSTAPRPPRDTRCGAADRGSRGAMEQSLFSWRNWGHFAALAETPTSRRRCPRQSGQSSEVVAHQQSRDTSELESKQLGVEAIRRMGRR